MKRKDTFFCLLPLLLSACSAIDSTKPFNDEQAAEIARQFYTKKPAQQMISLNLPRGESFKKIDSAYGQMQAPLTLIPMNETMDNWHESIRTKISGYHLNPDMNAKKLIQSQFADASIHCSHVEGRVLEQTSHSVVYQLKKSDCDNEKNLTQIGKAFNGVDAVYLVYYSAHDISLAQQNKMAYTIKTSKLEFNPRYLH